MATLIHPYWVEVVVLGIKVMLIIAIILTVLLGFTRFYTTLRYRFDLWTTSQAAHSPPRVPYTLPFLGQALDFLAPQPGLFYKTIFSRYTDLHNAGTCTLRLADQKAHVLYTPTAVQHLFRAPLSREKFNVQLVTKALAMSHEDAARFYGNGGSSEEKAAALHQQERMNHEFLLKPERVNGLTSDFLKVLRRQLDHEGRHDTEVDLYRWIRAHLFKASIDAFMGTGMLELYPDFEGDFFEFDRGFLTMFFGIPRIFARRIYDLRQKILDKLEAWQEQMLENINGSPADPEGPVDWEPNFGSRANRARQIYYAQREMSLRARGAMDLGFMFGAVSNAVPATGWMLMHLLDPNGDKTLLPRIIDELKTAEQADGTVDVATLVTLPLLTSTFHEILRLYVDVLVTREVTQPQLLPLDEGKNPRKVFLEKGSLVIAPSWLGHRDGTSWHDPPYDVFYAERFLKEDKETGKMTFTTAGSSGKLFPFGGGKTVCPGRVFAKQEVLASVAYVLLSFEFTFIKFVNEGGKTVDRFPQLRNGFTGSGIIVMDGDLRLRMKRRTRS